LAGLEISSEQRLREGALHGVEKGLLLGRLDGIDAGRKSVDAPTLMGFKGGSTSKKLAQANRHCSSPERTEQRWT
jgi:hypothetical protein